MKKSMQKMVALRKNVPNVFLLFFFFRVGLHLQWGGVGVCGGGGGKGEAKIK